MFGHPPSTHDGGEYPGRAGMDLGDFRLCQVAFLICNIYFSREAKKQPPFYIKLKSRVRFCARIINPQ